MDLWEGDLKDTQIGKLSKRRAGSSARYLTTMLGASLASLGRKSGYGQIHGWGDEAIKPLPDIKKGR